MTKIIGRLKNIGIAKEAVRGIGTSPTFWCPKGDITVEDKVVKARSGMNFGDINIYGNKSIVTKQWAEGNLTMDMYSQNFGLLLTALAGASPSSSGAVDSAYTHTYTVDGDSNQHQSLAITADETSIGDIMFRLAMLNSMSLTITPEETVAVSVDFMAKKSVGTSVVKNYTDECKFVGRDLSVKIEDETGDLTAGTAVSVKALSINFNKNTVLDHNLGTVEPEDIINQGMEISGEITLDYEDRTYRDLMVDGTYKAMRIDLTNTRDTIGAGAVNPEFTIDLSRVDFEAWDTSSAPDEVMTQTFSFMGLYDITNGNVVNALTLVNGHAGTNY